MFVYYGSAQGLSRDPGWHAEGNQAGARFGGRWQSLGAGDFNADGYSDVIVGASYYDGDKVDEGRAWIYYGGAAGPAAEPGWTAEIDQDVALFGQSVGTAGDVNGDGYEDAFVGALLYDAALPNQSALFVYYGSPAGAAAEPSWTAFGAETDSRFGTVAGTAGDVNGDGYDDLAAGERWYSGGIFYQGKVSLFLGAAEGLQREPAWTYLSGQPYASAGMSVGTAGDVNGDGFDDLIMDVNRWHAWLPDQGRSLVFYGSRAGLPAQPSWDVEGGWPGAWFGLTNGTAGDVNGDGYDDVVVGASSYDSDAGYDAGAAFLYLGSPAGLAKSPSWSAYGDQAGAEFGYVNRAGDVNGDGYDDVLVGAYLYDHPESNEGAVFLFAGRAATVEIVRSAVGRGVDDAYELVEPGKMYPSSDTVTTGASADGASRYSGGFLFRHVALPREAEITAAHLELVQKYQAGPVTLTIRGEAGHQADDFGPGSADINSRPRTQASRQWEIAKPEYGWVASPDIAGVIQEIVDTPGWWPGNNLALFLDPVSANYTTWAAFDADPQFAARLVVSYARPLVATGTPTATPAPSVTPTATNTPEPAATWTPVPAEPGGTRLYLPVIVD